ncbi:hypothetical protein [Actinacidiphila epipremni]|uniref:Lipoprotein n=1 Tax=Actinacidiphila epipremni TaxID=2053013 RepID=A0ABX0ZGZ9_9ACTN|nr:hypothetical protein [Actinacidiphila epipremni]NJP42422.1 hypothetical protein [Actinacidiphila epipremni]
MPAIARSLAAMCAAAAAGALLTGCLGDEDDAGGALPIAVPAASTTAAAHKAQPFADLTARQLLDKAVANMRASGAFTMDLTTFGYDGDHLKAAATTSGTCALSAQFDGENMQLTVADDGRAYLKGDDRFWYDSADDGDAAADRLAGKWARLTPQEYAAVGFDQLCHVDDFLDEMTSEITEGTLRKSAQITLDGRQVVPLVHTASGYMSTLFVSTGGTPYVVKSESGPDGTGETGLYSDFGKPPHVTAPPTSLTVDPAELATLTDDGGVSV